MSVLRNLEEKIAGLVEGTFGRVFRSEVRPVELARKLAKEMDEHRTVSVSRTYVPNEYVVWLSAEDRERYEGVEHEVIDELSAYLLEHARRERLALVARPAISFKTDERLSLGEFGIQARTVRAAPEGRAEQADHGHTMVYSTADRVQEPLMEERASRAGRAILVAEGKHHAIAPGGAVIGRSKDCDIVLDDANVSRRHAEIPRPRRAAGRSPTWAPPTGSASTGATCRRAARRRWSPATTSRSAPSTSASRSPDRARARLRRAEVRLPAGPLPVPAVGVAQRAEGPARPAGRGGGEAIPSTANVEATGLYTAAGGLGDDPRLVVERAPGHTPGMEYELSGGAVLAAATRRRSASRTRSPRPATPRSPARGR